MDTKLGTAKKYHRCEACDCQIYPGERYYVVATTPWDHPDNDGFYRWKFCRFCWETGEIFPREADYEFNQEFKQWLREEWLQRAEMMLGRVETSNQVVPVIAAMAVVVTECLGMAANGAQASGTSEDQLGPVG